jgi:peptidoglycan hydrolase-like protein with peptidoglycan-binding domain
VRFQTQQMRDLWSGYACASGKMVDVLFGPKTIHVADITRDAWLALNQVFFKHGYDIRRGDTGAYNCRQITDGQGLSLHAYGIAVDVNWTTNPRKITKDKRKVRFSTAALQELRARDVSFHQADTDMSSDMIADVMRIVTSVGHPIFAWGGHFINTKDTMHFQLDVSPAELAAGIVGPLDTVSAEDDDSGDGDNFGHLSEVEREFEPEVQQSVGLTEAVIRAAQTSQRVWGVPASVTLAQFILESAGGKRMPSGSNNPFGIKARSGDPFVSATTREISGGRSVLVEARFRKFSSFDEAFEAHARLLATSNHYVHAMAFRSNPAAFCDALTGIYATDPDYGSKLKTLLQRYNLLQYDVVTIDQGSGGMSETGFSGAGDSNLAGGMTNANVRTLQTALKTAGYSVGGIDGIYGPLTRAAILAFQADNGLARTGIPDDATVTLLNNPPTRPLSRERVSATQNDLRAAGSRTILQADRTKLLGTISGILGALGIGNSAAVNLLASQSPQTATTPTPPVLQFLDKVQLVLSNPETRSNPGDLNSLVETARQLRLSADLQVSPELLQTFKQIRQLIPPDVLATYPDIGKVFSSVEAVSNSHVINPHTVFDLLTTQFADGSTLQTIAQGLASVAGSIIPGFGGSLATVAVGILAHHFGNKIAEARVQDHRDASNLNR